jgi:hypothetical protein
MAGILEESNWDKSLKSFHPCYSQSPLLRDLGCSINHISIYKKYKKFLNVNVSASFCNLRVLVISPHNLGDDLVELIGDFYDLVKLKGDFYDLVELIVDFMIWWNS